MRSVPVCLLLAFLTGCGWNAVEQQAEKLGKREFSVKTWTTASNARRGAMTASFLRQHDVRDLKRPDLESLLGRPTGFYDYDTNVAYYVESGPGKATPGERYLLVFETDQYSGYVERVFFLPKVE